MGTTGGAGTGGATASEGGGLERSARPQVGGHTLLGGRMGPSRSSQGDQVRSLQLRHRRPWAPSSHQVQGAPPARGGVTPRVPQELPQRQCPPMPGPPGSAGRQALGARAGGSAGGGTRGPGRPGRGLRCLWDGREGLCSFGRIWDGTGRRGEGPAPSRLHLMTLTRPHGWGSGRG